MTYKELASEALANAAYTSGKEQVTALKGIGYAVLALVEELDSRHVCPFCKKVTP